MIGNTIGEVQSPTPGIIAFNPTTGGHYMNGSIYCGPGCGYWWSSVGRFNNRFSLAYTYKRVIGSFEDGRAIGDFIRCVAK